VSVVVKQPSAAIASSDDMIIRTGELNSWRTRHCDWPVKNPGSESPKLPQLNTEHKA